jgi:hypothetical protein
VSYVLEQGQACAACGRVLASSGGVTTWLAPERKARRRRDRRSGRIAADLCLLIPTLQVALFGGLACGLWGALLCVLSWFAGLLVGAIVRGRAPRAIEQSPLIGPELAARARVVAGELERAAERAAERARLLTVAQIHTALRVDAVSLAVQARRWRELAEQIRGALADAAWHETRSTGPD